MVVRKQRRSHQIAIRFTPQEIRILKRGAKEEGLTVSEYLRLMTLLYYYSMGLDNRVEVLSRELPQRLMDIFYLKRYRSQRYFEEKIVDSEFAEGENEV